ncbi:MAG: hypothetical protein ACFFD4_19230 [Candidatus Odinarchaeota archaeon]
MDQEKKESGIDGNDDHHQVTINTTFSGMHAKLILDYQSKFQCNKPTALRLILNQIVSGLLVTLDTHKQSQIARLIVHPILKERYGFSDEESFVNWAVNDAITRLTQDLGQLGDPSVQSLLDVREREVARQLLLVSRDLDYYGGVTVDHLNVHLKMDRDLVRRILDDFVHNGWVMILQDPDLPDRYLPKT